MLKASATRPEPAKREDVSKLIENAFLLSGDTGLPLYLRLHRCVEELIADEKLQPGAQMPPEQSLASTLGISLGTVQKGLQSLSSKRLVVRHHGRGTFVAEPRRSLMEPRLFRFLDPETGKFLPIYASIIERKIVAGTPELTEVLGEDREGYVQLSRIVDADGRFACYSELFLPASLFASVMSIPLEDFDNMNLKRLFAERIGIEGEVCSQRIRANGPSEAACEALKIDPGSRGIEMEIREQRKSKVIIFQRIYMPETLYPLDIKLLP